MRRRHGEDQGFTLLELSVVLGIIAAVAGGALVTLTAWLQASRVNATVARMDAIEDALLKYSTALGRLPCPSRLAYGSTNANYGMEATSNSNTCYGGAISADNQAAAPNQAIEGGVPTRTLRLPDSYMYDAWGYRIRYAVDPAYTAAQSIPVASGNCAAPTISPITVNDSSGTARTTKAAYVLVSHGANGHGGYTPNGTVFNAASTNTDEQTNCHCTSAGAASTYSPTYVEKLPTINAGSITDRFDDLVSYKEAWQLQTPNVPLTTGYCPTIYIADSGNNVIRKVSGGIITTISTNPTIGSVWDVALDSSGNFYVAPNAYGITKVAPNGASSTYAGGNGFGFSGDGGAATSAKMYGALSVATDSSGNLYIADNQNSDVRKVTAATGIISTFAGVYHGAGGSCTGNYTGDGGQAVSAKLCGASYLATDSADNVYISDSGNNVIRKVTAATGIITTIAGTGTANYGVLTPCGPPATGCGLLQPNGIAVDGSGNIYVAEELENVVLKVSASGRITTFAGGNGGACGSGGGQATSTQIGWPVGMAVDSAGNVYITDVYCNVIWKVTTSTGIITIVAGNKTQGDGGAATSAELNSPQGITVTPSR
jgi:prepilin-type N-terminal cleavage/methylation domain-containing protein